MYHMYDLIEVADSACDIAPCLERHITETLGRISIREKERGYVAEIPRQALVAVGVKSTYDSQAEKRRSGDEQYRRLS
jgi:hypothetical protein